MPNILVTGGRGFLGRHLCKDLASKGNHVVSVDKRPVTTINSSNSVQEIVLDVSLESENLNQLFKENQFEVIYHLSAFTSIRDSQKDINIDLSNTLMTTITILKMAQRYKIKKLIFTSSSTVYGIHEFPIKEDTCHLLPISYYGASKLACEAYISSFSHLYGIQCWVARCGNIIGADCDHGIIFDIKKQIRDGNKEINLLGDGSQEKPFLHISDFIRGLDCIVKESDNMYNLFLIGNSTTTNLKKLAGR